MPHVEIAAPFDTRRARMCEGKKRFGNAGAAENAVGRMRETGKLKRTDEINLYQCPFCQFWHFGHGKKDSRE